MDEKNAIRKKLHSLKLNLNDRGNLRMIPDVKRDVVRRCSRDRTGGSMDTMTVKILVNKNQMRLRDQVREFRNMLIHAGIMEGRNAIMVASNAVAMLTRIVAVIVQQLVIEVTEEAHKESIVVDLHRLTEMRSNGKGRVTPLVSGEEGIQIIPDRKGWRGLDQRLVSEGVVTVLGKWIAVLKINVVDEV